MTGRAILHVDDDPDFLALSETVLADFEGVTGVETHTDVSTALDRVAAGDVDCLLSDSVMTSDGDPLVVAARRTAPELPIVVFTGQEWATAGATAATAEAAGYVRKGIGCFERLRGVLEAVDDDRSAPAAVTLARHDWESDEELVVTLAGALATIQATTPETVDPIGEWVDVEALETLLSSASVDVAVSVTLGSARLLVGGDGRVAVAPTVP
jgi:DNA-binding NtrC family response regulator